MNILNEEAWYLQSRYGALWQLVAIKIKNKKRSSRARYKKPLHLIINELRNRSEFVALEEIHVIEQDMKLPYDYDRIQALIDTFMAKQEAVG